MRSEFGPVSGVSPQLTLRGSYGLFIGGSFVRGSSVFKTISPATEEVLAEVTHGTTEDVDRAVAAARQAYERVWSIMPGRERARYLLRIARLLRDRAPELALLESLDSGKPIRQTRDVDLPLAIAHFFYHAGWADKLAYAGFGAAAGGPARPLGVVGQVIGWSSPLLMLAWKIAPALACGNTVVLKPAESTPLTALAFAEICADAGLPPGVVNIVTGDGLAGQLVAGHPGIDKVAFTGSPEVGKEIAKSAALWGKRLTLELGGTAANIVCADADVDAAARGIVEGVFIRQGHACCSSSRVFVQEAVLDELMAAIKLRMSLLRSGDPLDESTDIGAVNSASHLDKLSELASSADAEGAVRWSAPCTQPDRGFWFPPTMFSGVGEEQRIAREELSWPVLTVSSFVTPEEAVERTNGTRYGLSAGVWTRQGALNAWLAARLRAGVVWANSFGRLDPAVPFGGYQESGLGREGGRHGLEAYLDIPGLGAVDVY
ncbi:aldehyde dehydrogenase family protein [Trebonia kvetii]|uniref:Aldehyde dehydrogenase family protein n=1 Tax=Trebonia kvetii TaxID=2480626 RepID=A0A6P2BVW4_9ACTN|nr:aldehyde dehydrogenase family protein [Trebonia kvetii]TVZ03068.1 aldehyde dehydrogenase family protein [Trebonia kvetii]